ncbi:MAG: dihydroorotate dehydrogenase electron transfer subunit [Negativicutes bacterium]|nr:dihydroorotate dehydrogenase electron transfer subunit [Negativicutes bacterium]
MTKHCLMAETIENRAITGEVFQLVLQAPAIAAAAQPGQFVMLRLSEFSDPLLRRPFSLAGADPQAGTVSILYRIVGRGTGHLAGIKPGTGLDVVGPLGKGFDLSGQRLLLVGGGMGLAPLLFAAQALCPRPLEVLAGGRTGAELFWTELFRGSCDKVSVTTDDGSLGTRGTCVDLLPDLLATGRFDGVLTCGPRPMLRRVAECAGAFKVPCQVSLEEFMACGVGACLSCTCDGKSGDPLQVCKDGPVFRAEEVNLA